MSNELARFSVAMPESLLAQFDELVERRGLAKNRSEVIRDLVREALIEDESEAPAGEVMGSLTIVYDHHANDLRDKLHGIQHDYFNNIVTTTHVHVDQHMCLEVIILRGESQLIRSLSDKIMGVKGVQNGRLVLTPAHVIEERHHHHD